MNPTIRTLLLNKGIEISDEDYEVLVQQWETLNGLKHGYDKVLAGEIDMALKYIAGGETV